MLKLSIITVNLNHANDLRKTITSVIAQSFVDFEYIVIDGGSSDGSKEIMEHYAENISYWISEPDTGIYNAMNKGIQQAKGEYCLFLNSGDELIDSDVFTYVFENSKNTDFIYGNVSTVKGIIKYKSKLNFSFFFNTTLCHQSVFIKRTLFEQFGSYNESLSIVADWEFFLKTIVSANSTYQYIDRTICSYDINGISSMPKYSSEILKQRKEVLISNFPQFYDDYVNMNSLQKELDSYKNSRIISSIRRIQNSKGYKKIACLIMK